MHIDAKDLVADLRSQDLRITEPRRRVCEVIAARHGEHLSAVAIYDIVQSGSQSHIDRATVYRTLDALEDAGSIRHSHIGHGPTVYHLSNESHHQHLVCERCGNTVAVGKSQLGPFLDAIAEQTGFHVDVDHFALGGLCRECSDAAPADSSTSDVGQ
ncbi:MAG: transcriptional repressor [Actinomycetia bacterium]|nr:transcriptional repressor [Actinomycetes bacterium]